MPREVIVIAQYLEVFMVMVDLHRYWKLLARLLKIKKIRLLFLVYILSDCKYKFLYKMNSIEFIEILSRCSYVYGVEISSVIQSVVISGLCSD